MKVTCKSEAVLNANQEPLTPLSLCSFFPVMFPYSQKYCVFTAPVFFTCTCKAQQHLNQTSDCKAGRSVKGKWKMCSQMPEVWLACSRELSFIFMTVLLAGTICYPRFMNEELRKRALKAWLCEGDSMLWFTVLVHHFKLLLWMSRRVFSEYLIFCIIL